MNRHQLLSAVTFGAALAFSSAISHAQPAPVERPIVDLTPQVINRIDLGPNSQTAQIKPRNVPVSLVAYWLDPMRQPKPTAIQVSEANAGISPFKRDQMPRQPGNGNGPLDLKMPPDVEIVAAVDPQNLLIVKGTIAGIEALRKLVEEIDVPLGNIEIEAQIWDMSPAKLKSLPLVFRDTAVGDEKIPLFGDVKVGDAPANGAGDFFSRTAFAAPTSNIAPVLQQLNEGLADGSARVITAPRMTAINGLTAKLTSTERRTLDFDKAQAPETAETTTNGAEDNDEKPTLANKAADNWKEGLIFVESQTGFKATPVLHGDLMNLEFQIILDNVVTPGNAIMRDGQTLAIRLPNANPRTGWPRLALIKARIIRRAGD